MPVLRILPTADDRRKVLLELLNWTSPLREVFAQVALFAWDHETTLVLVERHHLRNALTRYVEGSAISEEMEQWAEALESRDDVGFEDGVAELARELLWKLANPALEGPRSKQVAQGMLDRLG